MDKFYPPYFPCYIPLPNGKPAAGGKLYAYYTGTDNLAPLYAEDGTILVGSVADIDSSGQVHVLLDPAITYRLKVVPPVGSQMPDQIYDNVRVANGTIVGMENPMTEQGDMIVGGAAGAPIRLAHPGGIRFLRAAVVSGIGKVLQWVGLTAGQHITITHDVAGTTISADDQDGDHKVKAGAADNAPGVLYDKIGSITAPNGYIRKQLHTDVDGNQTLRLGIDATSATDGQVLTAHEIDGVCDPQWEPIPTQTGDHKTAVDGADTSPDYLAAKLAAGTGISLTNTGSVVEIAATAQTGDHKSLVSATDAAAGYLGAKLTAGSNVTITPQTDGDGVQTLEISATGGGGGGSTFQASGTPYGLKVIGAGSDDNYAQTRWNMFFPEIDKIRSVRLLMPGSIKRPNKFDCGIYMGTNYNSCALISSLTRSSQTWSGSDWQKFVFDADVDVSDKSKLYWVAFTTSKNQSTNIAYAVTMENSYADKNLQGFVTTNYAEMPASLPLGTGSLGIGLAFALDANP